MGTTNRLSLAKRKYDLYSLPAALVLGSFASPNATELEAKVFLVLYRCDHVLTRTKNI